MNELKHYGVKGMKWGVRKEREKSDGDQIPVSRARQKRNYKIVKRYAKIYNAPHNSDELRKAEDDFEDSFRKYAKTCKQAVSERWSALTRMHNYQEPYLDEWDRLNSEYISKHNSVYSEDDIPYKDRQVIKRRAAKNVGYDEKEYNRLRSDYEKALDNANRECKKAADQLLGKYGNTPVIHLGYANEQTAKDLVSETLHYLNWRDGRASERSVD